MNEKYLDRELLYKPRPLFLGRAAIHLALQPSDELQTSLHEFVVPEKRRSFHPVLLSDQVTQLHYTGADVDGLRYLSLPTEGSHDGVSDREWLAQYKTTLNKIKSQSIPVAAYRPRLERTKTGALLMELALLPTAQQKKNLGKSLLRHLRIAPQDDTPEDVIYARVLIAKSQLADDRALCNAQLHMMEHLGAQQQWYGDDSEQPHESPKAQRMFVKPAFINERIVSYSPNR